jgi:hypothetical protein
MYERNNTDHGFRQEIGQYANLERVLILGAVLDPEHSETLRGSKAVLSPMISCR